MNRRSLEDSDVPLSRRVGVRPPSWVSFVEEQPPPRKFGKADRIMYKALGILCFPAKLIPSSYYYNKAEKKLPKPPRVDPVEAWKTRVQLLEAEIERLNKKYDRLNRDYSKLYEQAEIWREGSSEAKEKWETLRDTHEDLARVVYEKYGRQEYRALMAKIEADKLEVERKRRVAAMTTLVINTKEGGDDL